MGLPEQILPALAARGAAAAGAGGGGRAVVIAHKEACTEEARPAARPPLPPPALPRRSGSDARRTLRTHPQVAAEAAVASALAPLGASLRLLWGHTLIHPDDLGIPPEETPILFSQWSKRAVEAAGARPRPPVPSERFAPGELPLARGAAEEGELGAEELPTLRELGYTDPAPAEVPALSPLVSTSALVLSASESAESQPGPVPAASDSIRLSLRPAAPQASPRAALRFEGGETAALARLRHYLWGSDAVATYFDTRDGMLGADFSTKLSPWLAAGCLSPRLVAAEVSRYERERVRNKSTQWVSFELLVRDWMRLLFLRHGAAMFRRGGVSASAWRWCAEPEQSARFAAWREGRTGWPLVDANMRELNETGAMPPCAPPAWLSSSVLRLRGG